MDMPTKKRTVAAQTAARAPLREIPAELIEQLVPGPMSPSEIQDLFLSFQKAVIERTMNAEMNLHLGYKPGQDKPEGQTNERNGASVPERPASSTQSTQADVRTAAHKSDRCKS